MLALLIICSATTLFLGVIWAADQFASFDHWDETAALVDPRVGPRLAYYITSTQTILFAIGGRRLYPEGSVILSTTLEISGQIAQWQPVSLSVTSTLPATLSLHAVAQTDKFFYVIGGWDEKNRFGQIWRGKFANWSCCEEIRNLPRKLVLHNAAVAANKLYVIGGVDENNQTLNHVYYSTIDANGGLGEWSEAPALKSPRARHAIVTYTQGSETQFYISGGYDGSTARGEVYCGVASGNNPIQGWRTVQHLREPMYYHQMTIHNNRLVISGGRNDETTFSAVYSAEIADTCKLGDWEDEPKLPLSLSRHAALALPTPNLSYVIGGIHSDISQSQVYYAAVHTPTPTPDVTPTATSTPTPTPGLAYLRLINQPDDTLGTDEEVTYFIVYKNGPFPLENVQIVSDIPAELGLITATVHAAVHESIVPVSTSNQRIVWTFAGSLAPEFQGALSYRAKIASAPSIITHTGVQAKWWYAGQMDSMTSNPAFNPSQKYFLPLVER